MYGMDVAKTSRFVADSCKIFVSSILPLTVSTNLARLNTAIVAHEQLEMNFSTLKDQTENEFQFLYNKNKLLKAENSHLKLQWKDADVCNASKRKSALNILKQVDDSGQQSTMNARAEKDDQQRASDDAIQSAYLLKLDAQDLPDYPMSIGEGKDKWCKYPATRKDNLILV
ncbi:uncharacterized protein EDB91DRAFT_1078079 [Suillus paluster]|uniref:uncharacterized protein n=1 Tax=Suillus paluster TaxID=48578 RepID=UPI001B8784FF|nr:uncharacterized protein EDB91DRAFT_1078079 [Suillus paluster]KAG1751259.1 hypothetical protein EDB91DRAFT_1078079 [Suillus paluster]